MTRWRRVISYLGLVDEPGGPVQSERVRRSRRQVLSVLGAAVALNAFGVIFDLLWLRYLGGALAVILLVPAVRSLVLTITDYRQQTSGRPAGRRLEGRR